MKDSMGGATVADLPLTSLQPRNGICPASATLLQFKVNDDDYDSNYESEDDSPTICSDSEGNKSIWRIFKAALPFQVCIGIAIKVILLRTSSPCTSSYFSKIKPILVKIIRKKIAHFLLTYVIANMYFCL